MNKSQLPLAEQIAHLALDTFDSLPSRYKPRHLPNSSREWTPLSAVVLTKSHSSELKIISLGTGTKSLPASALPKCHGLILHDCHAEILALRGFDYWILCELERMITQSNYESPWLERQIPNEPQTANFTPKPFRIKAGVEVHLFSTEAPCGDASMELLMAAAKASGADISPWPTSQVPSAAKASADGHVLPPGRGGFADLGALRRKPARADAEVSMSMSCTDKIMMKQFTGVLGFPADAFVELDQSAFLRSLVVYEDQYDSSGYQRAFADDGRVKIARALEDDPVEIQPRFFEVKVLPKCFRRFAYERMRSTSEQSPKSKVTNTSTVWIAGDDGKEDSEAVEVLVNGVKQGYKQFDEKPKKGSVLCRYNMLQKALAVNDLLRQMETSIDGFTPPEGKRYSELKDSQYRLNGKATKAWLLNKMGGWPMVGGDDFDVHFVYSNQSTIPVYLFPCSRTICSLAANLLYLFDCTVGAQMSCLHEVYTSVPWCWSERLKSSQCSSCQVC